MSRKVKAVRASVGSTGWQETKIEPQQIVAHRVVERLFQSFERCRLFGIALAADLGMLAARPASPCASCRWRGSWPRSSARRRACPECPLFGHCSSAATKASWASSSAWLRSRVKRVRPAMSFACSIRQMASIA